MGFSLKSLLGGSSGPKNPYKPVDFASLFKTDTEAPGNAYDYAGAYKSLMDMLNTDSPAEDAALQGLLSEVDTDTKGAYGSTIMDMSERGLVGEGQSSDIAQNALATVDALGAKTKSGIRSSYLVDKQKRRETAQAGWADLLAGMAESARGRNLQKILGLAGAQSGAYSNAANLAATQTPGLFQNLVGGFADKFGGNTADFLFGKK
ncbi:MAG: hypothetical protein E6Q97_19705 [Desulfurellales bacterium]|nr:MAG: hypothetical protein E6Q97_19705 [Desulfurellales bacterium]